MRQTFGCCLAAVAAMCAGAGAAAGPMLQIDINSLTIAAGRSFDASYTGRMVMHHDRNSSLSAIMIDGANQSVSAAWALAGFKGSLTIVGGVITSGSFEISVTDSTVVNTYTATLVDGASLMNDRGSSGFTTGGLTFAGMFSDSTFAGIDVSEWVSGSTAMDSLFNFRFAPSRRGFDVRSDVEIDFVPPVAAPLPTGLGLAAAGLMLLASGSSLIRRRR